MEPQRGTVTDIDGNYRLVVTDTSSVLSFNFIGLHTVETKVGLNTEINIEMIEDTTQRIIATCCCWSPPRYTAIGYTSGLNFTQFGFSIESKIPYVSGKYLGLESAVKYRWEGSNQYLNINLQRRDIARISRFDIGATGQVRKLRTSDDLLKEYQLSPSIRLSGFVLTLGYVHQVREILEFLDTEHDGITFGVSKYLPRNFEISATSQYLQDLWQYDIDITKHFYKAHLTVGAGYERIYKYDEFDLSLSYRFNY